MEPLLKETPNKGHNTFDLSIKDKFCDPYKTWEYNFTSERGQPLYNSKIMPKLLVSKCPLFRGSLYITYNMGNRDLPDIIICPRP